MFRQKWRWVLLLVVLALVHCEFPKEKEVYHWAEYWIATVDTNNGDTTLVCPTHDGAVVKETLKQAVPFYRDGQLKILATEYAAFWVLEPDGQSGLKLVENATTDYRKWALSPDCQFLVFSQSHGLYKIQTDGNGLTTTLVEDTSFAFEYPSLAADGRLVFVRRNIKTHVEELVLLTSNGDKLQILESTASLSGSYKHIFYSEFSPDGQYVYYILASNVVPPGLYSVNLTSGKETRIYPNEFYSPVIFAENGTYVFQADKHLYVGLHPDRTIRDLGECFYGYIGIFEYDISSDGQWITYVPDNALREIWIMRSDGSQKRKLVEGLHPYFIPGEKRILCFARRWYQSTKYPGRHDWITY